MGRGGDSGVNNGNVAGALCVVSKQCTGIKQGCRLFTAVNACSYGSICGVCFSCVLLPLLPLIIIIITIIIKLPDQAVASTPSAPRPPGRPSLWECRRVFKCTCGALATKRG
jgi:hypothetical protein